MTWAIVLGGAQCVWEDKQRAEEMFGEPDVVVAVKDIGMVLPKVDAWVTFHADRVKRELQARRNKNLPDPAEVWTYAGVKVYNAQLPIYYMKIKGGSSGLLGALVGIRKADKAILCGIPLDPDMRHYHDRKGGKPWREGQLYIKHWPQFMPQMKGRVKSMSGNTMRMLGYPSREWLFGDAEASGTNSVQDVATG